MNIIKGKVISPLKIVIYGTEGIGKSTFASQFPDPLFIDTEDSTKNLDVARFEKPTSWTMLLDQIKYVQSNPNLCQTLVIDTADWAEQLAIDHLCARYKWSGLEDPGYGRGYQYCAEEFGKILNALNGVINVGINVVVTAHACQRKVDLPEEMGSFDHWEMKTTRKVAPMIREWADMVLFANYETVVVKSAENKNKAQGSKRVMYTEHHACWDAKNRVGLAPKLPFEYAQIAAHIPAKSVTAAPAPVSAPPTPAPIQASAPAPVDNVPPPPPPPVAPAFVEISPEEAAEIEAALSMQELSETANNKTTGNVVYTCSKQHEQLADLMNQNGVSPEEIQEVVAMRGYYPKDTKIEKYDPAFVGGALVAAWSQVYEAIKNTKIPF